jgi:glycosyltransferase involved in cell wall biosynthesis
MSAAPKGIGRRGRPALSVITPSYASGAFIAETLDSVAALSVSHEHIVIDGGSIDGTTEILERRSDERLRWISEPDRGQTHAVNKGIERAKGELLAWLNADDAYIPDATDAAVETLLGDPDIDAVFGFIEIVDERGAPQRTYRCGRFSWMRYLYFGEYLPTPTIIFRRRLLERAPQLDERYRDAADYDFYLRLLRGARVRRIPRPLVRFRYHGESKTASNPALQRREGLEIRLGYARNALDRGLMRLVDRTWGVRNRLVSHWPEPESS